MGIEDLKARLERLLGEYSRPADARARSHDLHAALVDLKVGLRELAEALVATERELGAERHHLATAERRGKLAEQIGDTETQTIAGQFVNRHRERLLVLERKLAVQRDELAISEREYAELSERYRVARQGLGLESQGIPRPVLDEDEVLRVETDRRATDAAVKAQLEALKKKMGKG